VRNEPSNRDWNCQNWVGEALSGLVAVGAVTVEQRGLAIGAMTDVILEAEDEEFDVSFPTFLLFGRDMLNADDFVG
jgi:hypothetical protein